MFKNWKRTAGDERGIGLVAYALILALIVLVVVVIFVIFQDQEKQQLKAELKETTEQRDSGFKALHSMITWDRLAYMVITDPETFKNVVTVNGVRGNNLDEFKDCLLAQLFFDDGSKEVFPESGFAAMCGDNGLKPTSVGLAFDSYRPLKLSAMSGQKQFINFHGFVPMKDGKVIGPMVESDKYLGAKLQLPEAINDPTVFKACVYLRSRAQPDEDPWDCVAGWLPGAQWNIQAAGWRRTGFTVYDIKTNPNGVEIVPSTQEFRGQ